MNSAASGFHRSAFVALVFSTLLLLTTGNASAQGTSGQVSTGQSSEWDATAFNNGRRVVRDANGFFHAFWHSQPLLPTGPMGAGADIFYAYTLAPAAEPPSMAQAGQWSAPVPLTQFLTFGGESFLDHRYPSVAIEYEIYDRAWPAVNNIHLVWQALLPPPSPRRYEVLHATLPIANPPASMPVIPLTKADNLSQTAATDSLVPSVAVNRYDPDSMNQHVHVVWQEEDINGFGVNPPDAAFSDIAYIRSTNSGVNWAGPAGGWLPYPWDNISQTASNSQMPSVSCMLDQFSGGPAKTNRNELGYNSRSVHVAYHEDFWVEDPPSNQIHIFYTRSPDDGTNWLPRVDVTAVAAVGSDGTEAYPSLAVDMADHPHIAYMIDSMTPAEPLRAGSPSDYQAGLHPWQTLSFPGPNPGMFATQTNRIAAVHFDGSTWSGTVFAPWTDHEFPTLALDRWQHINVSYQAYFSFLADYEVMRETCLQNNTPAWPLLPPSYGTWSPFKNDSQDLTRDDLFPNLAHKRSSMYSSTTSSVAEAVTPGYDEVWTKTGGHGADEAISMFLMRDIWQDGNMRWVDPNPSQLAVYGLDALLVTNNSAPSQTSGTGFGLVALNQASTNTLSLVNLGAYWNIVISGLSTNGSGASQFGGSTPSIILPQATNDIHLNFHPTLPGISIAMLAVTNDSQTPVYRFNLAGVGAYLLVGASSGPGTITPSGEILMAPGDSTNFVLQASVDHYIGTCETNSQSIPGVAGLTTYSVQWNNVSQTGLTYAAFLNVTNDTATNGTSVTWLRDYYTNETDLAALVARAAEDSDGDGADGWEEYFMDTDPTNISSVLDIVAISNLPPLTVYFPSSTNRQYTLQSADNLLSNTWTNVSGAGPRTGTGGTDSLSDATSTNMNFYRIRVEVP